MWELVLGAGLGFLAGLAVGLWRRCGAGAEGAGAASEDEAALEQYFALPDSPRATLRATVEEVDELRRLYECIGFSPIVEDEVHHILRALRASIAVDIPDYDAFLEALVEAREQMGRLPDEDEMADAAAREDLREAETVLDHVWRRRDTPSAVREQLADAPIDCPLPFIERVPVARGGTVHWRTPVRVDVLRKHPDDPSAFQQRLDRLAELVRTADLERPDSAEADLRSAIDRLREGLRDETLYVPTLLKRLEEAAQAWVTAASRSAARTKKTALDEFVLAVCRLNAARPRLLDDSGQRPAVSAPIVRRYRERVVRRVRTYVHTPWMHAEWLTDGFLEHLLTAEMLEASGELHTRLAAVVREIHHRTYDPPETMRRLRTEDGEFVQSLAFALLRLRGEAVPASAE